MRKTQAKILSERDRRITFEENNHIYYIDNEQCNMSVTGVVASMFPPFPRHSIAKNCAKRDFNHLTISINSKIILVFATWNYAALVGSATHDTIETAFKLFARFKMPSFEKQQQFMGKLLFGFDPILEYEMTKRRPLDLWQLLVERELNSCSTSEDELCVMKDYINATFTASRYKSDVLLKLEGFLKFWDDHHNINYVHPEYMIFDEDIRLCGTIDMICSTDRTNIPDNIFIIDWKTNKSLGYSLNKYYCQLHMYARILEDKYNSKVTRLSIVHFIDGNYKIFDDTKFSNCNCKNVYKNLKANKK